jgi:hypothetical protein
MGKIDHPKSSDGQNAINSSRSKEIALHVHLFTAAESFRAAFGTLGILPLECADMSAL